MSVLEHQRCPPAPLGGGGGGRGRGPDRCRVNITETFPHLVHLPSGFSVLCRDSRSSDGLFSRGNGPRR